MMKNYYITIQIDDDGTWIVARIHHEEGRIDEYFTLPVLPDFPANEQIARVVNKVESLGCTAIVIK